MAAEKNVTRVLDAANLTNFLAKDENKRFAEALSGATEVKDSDGRVISLVGNDIRADILTAKTKVEEKDFDAEYVSLSAITIEGAALLMSGVVDETFEGTGEDKKEKPSVVKYFNQGFGILARNAAAARIRVKVEGPDKALMASAKGLARAKGWDGPEGIEKALKLIKALGD